MLEPADQSVPHLDEELFQSRLEELVAFHNAMCELTELLGAIGAECLTICERLRSQGNHYPLELIKGESLVRQAIRIDREAD